MSFANVALLLALIIMCSSSSTFTGARGFEGKAAVEGQKAGVDKQCGIGTWCISSPEAEESKVAKDLAYECTVVRCDDIKPGQPCFEPDNTYWHASVIFNRYYRLTGCDDSACVGDHVGLITHQDPSFHNVGIARIDEITIASHGFPLVVKQEAEEKIGIGHGRVPSENDSDRNGFLTINDGGSGASTTSTGFYRRN
ncbi:hypothetical protein ACLOJK_008916 [Asimina triloba]